MKTVLLDKIASVTSNVPLRKDVRVSDDFPCRQGDVLAVRILNSKGTYNTLELSTGRMSSLKAGDVIAGALGHRNALQGYSGVVPKEIKVGDTIHLLNLGGVLGQCTSFSPIVGAPFECEVLGQVLHFPFLASRVGVPANISHEVGALDAELKPGPWIIAVAGTCMNSGKTEACTTLIQQLTRQGLKVAAAKTTGVSLRRDVLGMEDAGAFKSSIFTDLGIVTTDRGSAPGLARTLINRLSEHKPDVIVLELGDGLLGEYGVDAILEAPDIRNAFSCILLAAGDPVAAWGGYKLLQERYQLTPTVITGPATDNLAGTELIQNILGVPAINARQNAQALADCVKARLAVARG
ncbi:MAG: hypothetical protein JSS72_06440 [Armatimonadetes bacterium]|nr:hypothetical protein [Armatimonadota bacterium]